MRKLFSGMLIFAGLTLFIGGCYDNKPAEAPKAPEAPSAPAVVAPGTAPAAPGTVPAPPAPKGK